MHKYSMLENFVFEVHDGGKNISCMNVHDEITGRKGQKDVICTLL
jgi:hypothetical protein